MAKSKAERRERIRRGIRKKIHGTAERPRLCVFRSNKEIYCQFVDDDRGVTLAAASSRDKGIDKSLTPIEQAFQVGKLAAERALQKGITKVVFDRAGYLYHGRVKALAEGAREGGLDF